jgi:hypothetical protein
MTEKEIMELEEGTPVRIKRDVDCHQDYKDGGTLTFGNSSIGVIYEDDENKVDEDGINVGFVFGILIEGKDKSIDGVCYSFPASYYELE